MESTPTVIAGSSGVGHGVDGGQGANILLLPIPEAQGHMNPMLQFGRRLAYHGLRPTLVATRYVLSVTTPPGDPFRVAAISDGFDAGGLASCPDVGEYISRLEAVGSETLRELIVSEAPAGRPVRVLVYDPHMPWALRVARAAGVPAAAFFSQPCSVNIVYGELWTGRLALPATDGRELVARGALGVELGFEDMPPFTAVPELMPEFLKTSIGQFNGLEDADDVLVNSFSDIEPKAHFLVVPATTTSSNPASHGGASVLLFPMPGAQGHLNPMLQFGLRLAYHGLRPTLVSTHYLLSTTTPPGDPIRVAAISDGFDAGGSASCPDIAVYISRLATVGSETLRELFLSEAREGQPVRVLLYDPHLAWAPRVARAAGVPTAAFFSQPCAVNIIYGELWAGRLALPVTDVGPLVEKGALGVELGPEDVPPFVAAAAPKMSPGLRKASIGQFEGLEEADDVLVNSFSDMEPKVEHVGLVAGLSAFANDLRMSRDGLSKISQPQPRGLEYGTIIPVVTEAKYMESAWRAKMVGPTLPSFYLDDDRLPSNKSYGFNLFSGDDSCMDWMDKQTISSVVLVSYGTFSQYNAAQLEEIGNGLCNSGKPFLWVVRSNESHKLSEELKAKCGEKGLIVSWCPQLAVLAHKSIGCFVTHCGWNSTLEAIVCGVPLVGIPHWADQPTIAKYVQSAWGIGVRAKHGDNGWIKREEVDRCIKEVMDGERKDEYRKNALKWMEKAKEAMQEGGSSDKNILEFAAKYSSI